MEKKILILGAKGMLGSDLAQVFSGKNPVCFDRSDLDITDEKQVKEKIKLIKPEIIINAAGFTDVEGAEENCGSAFKVNGDAVGYLAQAAEDNNAILVHYSTEYVFDGRNKNGYSEEELPNPLNNYGKSKAMGERLLSENCRNFYLIRSSWLYGKSRQKGKPRGVNFVDVMFELSRKQEKIEVVNDQYGRPTFSYDLAKATRDLLENNAPCGIYHLVNESLSCGVSWFELAQEAFRIKGVKIPIIPVATLKRRQKVNRPAHGVLLNTKFKKLRPWQEALKNYLNDKLI
ncbi:dTDP-4-dehydrorhamnose reductase [Candidatus Parcubacteria bacterium]|nr:MAG: dTDP-4-dehydrorhamnose reductase [Candidatus Parcubacteria bacterium]